MVGICIYQFAQDSGSSAKNWISGEVGLLGGGIRYERMLTEKLSVGGTVFFNSFFLLWNSIGVNATARYYFWKGLYGELGVGYGTVTGTEDYNDGGWSYRWVYTTQGAMITPGIGWKIDLGQPGAFFINPHADGPDCPGDQERLGWGKNIQGRG